MNSVFGALLATIIMFNSASAKPQLMDLGLLESKIKNNEFSPFEQLEIRVMVEKLFSEAERAADHSVANKKSLAATVIVLLVPFIGYGAFAVFEGLVYLGMGYRTPDILPHIIKGFLIAAAGFGAAVLSNRAIHSGDNSRLDYILLSINCRFLPVTYVGPALAPNFICNSGACLKINK